MSGRELFSPMDFKFAKINGKEFLFPSLDDDPVFNIKSGFGYECSGMEDFVSILAEQFWGEEPSVIEKIKHSQAFKTVPREDGNELTIAIYYRCLTNGGAQRVTAMLANLWAGRENEDHSKKYKVVLITDEKSEPEKPEDPDGEEDPNAYLYTTGDEEEYEVEESIVRAYLPPYKESAKENYRARYKAWEQIIHDYDIDVVVSGLWASSCTFWDMLSVKGNSSHPAFILLSHSFCCFPFYSSENIALRLQKMYGMCDAVVVLSETDKRYVENFAGRTEYIPNPVAFPEDQAVSAYEKNTVLWVGRFSWEKRPLDAVNVFDLVADRFPDAKLYMVGSGDRKDVEEVLDRIRELGLEDNVCLTGFTKDVEQYYKKASVFMSTSLFEGFPTAAAEAFSFGIPIAGYEMPWLAIAADERGMVSVEQENCKALAEKICALLDDPEIIRKTGKAGREKIAEFARFDVAGAWDSLFRAVFSTVPKEPQPDILLKYMAEYQQMGKEELDARKTKQIASLRRQNTIFRRSIDRKTIEKRELKERIRELKDEKAVIRSKLQKEREDKKLLAAKLKKDGNKKVSKDSDDQKKKIVKLEKELKAIKKSRSYRIGRLITAPVRKLKKHR